MVKIRSISKGKWLFCIILSLGLNFIVFSKINKVLGHNEIEFNDNEIKLNLIQLNNNQPQVIESIKNTKKEIKPDIKTVVSANKSFKKETEKAKLENKKIIQNQDINKAKKNNKITEKAQESSIVLEEAKVKRQFPPNYPNRAKRLGQEGIVHLEIQISKSGFAEEIRILTSSGYPDLDIAAINAVKKWEFEPNKTSSNWAKLSVNFLIKNHV